MTIDALRDAKRLEAIGVPREQAEAQAEVLRDELATNVVTSTDLGAAVDRIDSRFDLVDARFTAIDARFTSVDAKIDHAAARAKSDLDTAIARLEATMLRQHMALLLAVVTCVGLMFRFIR